MLLCVCVCVCVCVCLCVCVCVCVIRLSYCVIGAEAFSALSAALVSHPSVIRKLALNFNELGDAGALGLAAAIKDPRCKLEKLWSGHTHTHTHTHTHIKDPRCKLEKLWSGPGVILALA